MTFERVGCGLTTTATTNTTTTNIAMSNFKSLAVITNNTAFFQDNLDNSVSNIKPLDYIMLVVTIICFLILLGGTIKLYRTFHWNAHLFHTFDTLRNTLIAWAIFTGFLKIDVFYLFVYAVQLVPLSLMTSSVPAFESVIMFGCCLLVFILATLAIRNENVKQLIVFSGALVVLVGYFGYRLFTFIITRTDDPFKV